MTVPLILPISDLVNPLTPFAFIRTLFFQVVILGIGTLFVFLKWVPYLEKFQGMHLITEEEKAAINANFILRLIYKKAKRWYNHIWYSLASTATKTIAFFFLSYTLFILVTDIGWLKAFQQFGDWQTIFLMARASGAQNGAHLLSYIPLPLLGLYVAWKYKKDYLLDCYQGILIVAFGVGIHEGIWIIFYYAHYSAFLNLDLTLNITEDVFFSLMCVMLMVAFWKYPFRQISLKLFRIPILLYTLLIIAWYFYGMPVTTINNYQIGQGTFMITSLWADPIVNGIEIFSWAIIPLMFFLAMEFGDKTIPR